MEDLGLRVLEGTETIHNLKKLVGEIDLPLTEARICGLDSWKIENKFALGCYPRVLEKVLDMKDMLDMALMKGIFCPQSATFSTMLQSFTCLLDFIKSSSGPNKKLDNIINLISYMIKSESLLSAFIEGSLHPSEESSNFALVLSAIPAKISNFLKSNLKDFSPDDFSNTILVQLAKCIAILHTLQSFSLYFSSDLCSKVIEKFSILYGNCISLNRFFKVLDAWCTERENFISFLELFFENLDPRAIEKVIIVVSKNCKYLPLLILNLISKNETWKYIGCKKLIFYTYSLDASFIKGLVTCFEDVQLLKGLLNDLVKVWSSRTSIRNTSFEQHLYISKIIVLISSKLKNKLNDSDCYKYLTDGVSAHLESNSSDIKVVGMAVSECLIESIDGPNSLTFDYSGLNSNLSQLVNDIKGMYANNCNDSNFDHLKGDELLLSMENEMSSSRVKVLTSKDLVKELSSSNVDSNSEVMCSIDNLDSDDDLEPYDLSNDVEIKELERPKYLRDMLEGFGEKEKADVWIGSLEVCEELVLKDLADDDISLGLQILSVLISLQQEFYCERFDDLKFNGAVAVVSIYPKESAEYLCNEFHRDVGLYSISHRLFILQVLSASALRLSRGVEVKDEFISDVKIKIVGKSRKITSKTKLPNKRINYFANVAASFLFPLLRGGTNSSPLKMSRENEKHLKDTGSDFTILLIELLRTVSVIMMSSENSPAAPRMAFEVLEAIYPARFHPDPQIIMCVISCIASVIISVPPTRLVSDFFDLILEAKHWLYSLCTTHFNSECKVFSSQVLNLINKQLSSLVVDESIF